MAAGRVMQSETPTAGWPDSIERRAVPRAAPRIFALTVIAVAAATLAQVIAPLTSGSDPSPSPSPAASTVPASAGLGIAGSSPGVSGADAGPRSRTGP